MWVVVSADAVAAYGDAREDCRVDLIVDRGRPVEIGLRLVAEPDNVRWISRELLTDGLWESVGDGDVRIVPHYGRVSIVLFAVRRGDVTTELVLPRRIVKQAVATADRVSPKAVVSEWIERAVKDVIARCREGRRA